MTRTRYTHPQVTVEERVDPSKGLTMVKVRWESYQPPSVTSRMVGTRAAWASPDTPKSGPRSFGQRFAGLLALSAHVLAADASQPGEVHVICDQEADVPQIILGLLTWMLPLTDAQLSVGITWPQRWDTDRKISMAAAVRSWQYAERVMASSMRLLD